MTLRVFVQVWCEIDPTLNVRVDRQTGVATAEPGDRLRRVSPLGRAGVAAALALGDVTLTAFALGAGHDEALTHALAAGAARAVELVADGGAIAAVALAEWLRRESADLVIADRVAGAVAAHLGWAHLAGLDELCAADGVLRAVRFLDRGDREVVTARLPAAIRLQGQAIRAPYVVRSRIQAAERRPIERHTVPGQETSRAEVGPLQAARARARLGQAPAPAAVSARGRLEALMGGGKPAVAARAAEKSAATAEQMAEELVRYLLHHDLLPRQDGAANH